MTSRIDVEILEARDNDVLIPPMGLRAFFFGKMLKKVATFVLAHSAPSTYTTVRLRVQVSLRPCFGKERVLARLGWAGVIDNLFEPSLIF
jgi:hypothetical protein